MSRKSFRKSKGRKTRSMRKRTMGGEGTKPVQDKYSEVKAQFDKGRALDRLDNFLTSSEACAWYGDARSECERKKVKYYSAVKYVLDNFKFEIYNATLPPTPGFKPYTPDPIISGELEAKINTHSVKVPDYEAVINKGQQMAAKDFKLESPTSTKEMDELAIIKEEERTRNERGQETERIARAANALAKELQQKQQGGRKSRRKRKSRRR